MSNQRLVLCAKSAWTPAIRREHAFAQQAALHGYRVDFIERPLDIRSIGAVGAPRWVRLLTGQEQAHGISGDVAVWRRATPAPGHRDRMSERADNLLLGRLLSHWGSLDDAVCVANVPWQWPAVSKTSAARRVFDCADNWAAMIPHREARVREHCRRVAAEADTVVVANPSLAELFPGREVTVVRNATAAGMTDGAPVARPNHRRLVYVGTLSERFDAPLMNSVLDQLPTWHLVLYGPCSFAGHGDQPDEALAALLGRRDGRATWQGMVSPSQLASVLDQGDVLVLPNRRSLSTGQDSMKLYDYTARGRPVVSTRWDAAASIPDVPHVMWANGADEFVAAIESVSQEPTEFASNRVEWATRQTYGTRWHEWKSAVFGGMVVPDAIPSATRGDTS